MLSAAKVPLNKYKIWDEDLLLRFRICILVLSVEEYVIIE